MDPRFRPKFPTSFNRVSGILLLSSLCVGLGACSGARNVDPLVTASIPDEASAVATEVPAVPSHRSASIGDDAFRSVRLPFSGPAIFAKRAALLNQGDAGYLGRRCPEYDRCSFGLLAEYRDALGPLAGADMFQKLVRVNALVNNSLAYAGDEKDRGRRDNWQGFFETVNRGAGDCEDFAVVKYSILHRAGLPAEAMSITVLKDHRRDLTHAVLIVRVDGRYYVLDNRLDAVFSDEAYPEYEPLYSVTASGAWLHGKRSRADTAALVLPNGNGVAG